MRKNDFFKYLLLNGGSNAAKRSELETQTLPYTFNSNSYKLRNYRIYGNTVNEESVGDLVTEGEYAGEYRVPVKVEGKNLLQNTATSQTVYGVTFTVNDDGSVTCNGRRENTSTFFTIGSVTTSGETILSGCLSGGSSTSFAMRAYSATISSPRVYYDIGDSCRLNTPDTYNIDIRIQSEYTCDNLTFYPMIRRAEIADGTYEPYHVPTTTNIFLSEQIKKVGDEAEYIDYKEQKQYFADGTSIDVTLPALPTLSGTNTLSVGTTVQPSKVYLQGKISEAEIVSAEPVQTNVQSLQPISLNDDLQLDVMPIDRSEFQINDISEVPVEDENSVEEIPETENFETSGDEENAK